MFTASGSPGTDATRRSRMVKSKMEECDSRQFYCSILRMPTLCMMRILQPLFKGIKVEKICWQDWSLTLTHWGSSSLGKSADGDTWRDVMFDCNMSALWQVRSVDARETEQNFKLKPKYNFWFPCFKCSDAYHAVSCPAKLSNVFFSFSCAWRIYFWHQSQKRPPSFPWLLAVDHLASLRFVWMRMWSPHNKGSLCSWDARVNKLGVNLRNDNHHVCWLQCT